ncbi:MAG TPA: hypothetical protein VHP33_36750 [Polyangiaceae bacterium]|nr:hypothetical protein [Polyangiaceae bacterium]
MFSWRALGRCRNIAASRPPARALPSPGSASVAPEASATDFEQELELRELNAELNLAKRNVKGLAQVAFTGGLGLAFWALAGGREHQPEASLAFALGGVGGVACLGVSRKIGSLADGWRSAVNSAANRKRRRQGVDPSERTG